MKVSSLNFYSGVRASDVPPKYGEALWVGSALRFSKGTAHIEEGDNYLVVSDLGAGRLRLLSCKTAELLPLDGYFAKFTHYQTPIALSEVKELLDYLYEYAEVVL